MSSPATSNAAVKDNHPAMVKQAADATAAAKEKEDSGARAAAREAAADAAAAAATAPPSAPAPVPGGSLQFRSDMLLVGGKPGLFHCNYCMRDISNTIRIKCAETSTCPDWDLCVDCFGAGVELGKHKNDHPYRVVDNTAYPIFAPDWTATEELLMLSALEAHGMGNWGKVAEVLNSKDKTEKACMEHYLDLYLHSYGSILPKDTVGYGKTHDLLTEEQRKEYVIGPPRHGNVPGGPAPEGP
ncbi:histone acetyltransferase complex partial, partial [Nannochloropsis oceanica]